MFFDESTGTIKKHNDNYLLLEDVLRKDILSIFEKLEQTGVEFGYRTINEIKRFTSSVFSFSFFTINTMILSSVFCTI